MTKSLGKANELLRQLSKEIADFLENALPELDSSEWWRNCVLDKLSSRTRSDVVRQNIQELKGLDFSALKQVLDRNWNDLRDLDPSFPNDARHLLHEIGNYRNQFSHVAAGADIKNEEIERFADTVRRFAEAFNFSPELQQNAQDFWEDLRRDGGLRENDSSQEEEKVATTDNDEVFDELDGLSDNITEEYPSLEPVEVEGDDSSLSLLHRRIDYYRHCVAQENLNSQMIHEHWQVPVEEPCLFDCGIIDLANQDTSKLQGMRERELRRPEDAQRQLLYGWPVFRIGERQLISVFTVPVKLQDDKSLVLETGAEVTVNPNILSVLGKVEIETRQATEEEINSLADIEDKVQKLQDLGWTMPEKPIAACYYYDSAGAITASLLKELGKRFGMLDARAVADLENTPVQWLLAGQDAKVSPNDAVSDSMEIQELFNMNENQLAAVRCALTQPLTVVTGPPGTGKSQVVLQILCNAALQGKSVVFASKNNHAVDVVRDRLKGDGFDRDLSIRVGNRNITRQAVIELDRLCNEIDNNQLVVEQGEEDVLQQEEADLRTKHRGLDAEIKKIDQLLDAINDRNEELAEYTENGYAQLQKQRSQILAKKKQQTQEWAAIPVELRETGEVLYPFAKRKGTLLRYELRLRQLTAENKRGVARWLRRFWTRIGYTKHVSKFFENIQDELSRLPESLHDYHDDNSSSLTLDYLLKRCRDLLEICNEARQLRDLHKDIVKRKEDSGKHWEEKRRFEQDMQTRKNEIKRLCEKRKKLMEREPQLWERMREVEDELRINQRKKYCLQMRKNLIENQHDTVARIANYKGLINHKLNGPAFGGKDFKSWEEATALLTNTLPLWVVTSLSVPNAIPLKSGLFDILVIDEASQCDIASALPLFYRAKNVVVIGDPMQLKHVSTIQGNQDQSIARTLCCPEMHGNYSNHSLYDLACYISRSRGLPVHFLPDHYRSSLPVMKFISEEFYERYLGINLVHRTLSETLRYHRTGVFWIDVQGRVSPGRKENSEELQKVLELTRLLLQSCTENVSIGVTTPFRHQANQLRNSFRGDEFARVTADTVHVFQGAERDVMILSPVISDGAPETMAYFVNDMAPQLLNVGVSRARSTLFVVGDKKKCSESGGHLRSLAEFAKSVTIDELRSQEELTGLQPTTT